MDLTKEEGADSSTPSNCSLFRLPEQIIFRVFSELPLRERGMALRTCRWMDLCGRESWGSVMKGVRLDYNICGIEKEFSRFGTVWSEFDLPAPQSDTLCARPSNQPSFTENLFPKIGSDLVELSIVGNSCNVMQAEAFNDNWIEKILGYCPNLKTVNLSGPLPLPSHLTATLAQLNLENLRIRWDDRNAPSKQQLSLMLSTFNNLKRLSLDPAKRACLLSLPAPHLLTHLFIEGSFNEHAVIEFIGKCPSLLHFTTDGERVHGWNNTDADILAALAQNCPKIEVISLCYLRLENIPHAYEGNRYCLKKLTITCDLNGAKPPDSASLPLAISLAGYGVLLRFDWCEVMRLA